MLSNRRSGTLEITVEPPGAEPEHGRSPWEAMSGAAVWAGDRIIGVVTLQHPREGPARLTATRIDTCLGARARPGLGALLGLADGAGPDTVTPPGAPAPRSAYLETVRDIAPAGGLLDRADELNLMARFCAGAEQYLWWRAEPWTGKSALLSTFVLDPPDGVEVVSFFVTARLAAQSDSTAFTDALLDQLAALLGESVPPSLTGHARERHRATLLRTAADRAQQEGRQLVLVVDGLDEDRGAGIGSGLPSIASLLPRATVNGTPDAVKVIVASRPDPPIPHDVPAGHPLRIVPPHTLHRSPHAGQTARRAGEELDGLLVGGAAGREVIGVLAACGGGLTLTDLEEVLDRPPYELEQLLTGVGGRTVAARRDTTGQTAQQVYLFTHETLRVHAVRRLGPALLERHRQRIHAWAQGYEDRGWPDDTPRYLFRGYPLMVQEQADTARLVRLATDVARHDRMLSLTGGDAAALAELKSAQTLVMAADEPDLLQLARIAMHRDDLADRNAFIPVDLPAVWAVLGQPARAEGLARGITDQIRQTEALWRMLAAAGTTDEAGLAEEIEQAVEAIVRTISDPERQVSALARLAGATATAGNIQRARALSTAAETAARSIREPYQQAQALLHLVEAFAAAADIERAQDAARLISDPDRRARALAEVVETLLDAGSLDEAMTLAHDLRDTHWRSVALARVAQAMVIADRTGEAQELAMASWRLARTVREPERQGPTLHDLAATMTMYGDPRRAQAIVRGAVGNQSGAYLRYARGFATRGAADRAAEAFRHARANGDPMPSGWWQRPAAEFADDARLLVAIDADGAPHDLSEVIVSAERGILWRMKPEELAAAKARLAAAAAALGEVEHTARLVAAAEEAVKTIGSEPGRQRIIAECAVAACAAGQYPTAERLVALIADPQQQVQVMARLALAAAADDPEWATAMAVATERTARMIAPADDRVRTIAALLRAASVAAVPGLMVPVAAAARRLVAGIVDPRHRDAAVDMLVTALAATDQDESEAISILLSRDDDPQQRLRLLLGLGQAAVASGDLPRATRHIEELAVLVDAQPHGPAKTVVQIELCRLHAAAGDADRAVRLAGTLNGTDARHRGLTEAAAGVAATGDEDRAEALARSIGEPGDDDQNVALARVAKSLAAAGRLNAAIRIVEGLRQSGWLAISVADLVARRPVPVADGIRDDSLSTTIVGGTDESVAGKALVAARKGDHESAGQALRSADRHLNAIAGMEHLWSTAGVFAETALLLGDRRRAVQLVQRITGEQRRSQVVAAIIRRFAQDHAGQLDDAEAFALAAVHPDQLPLVLVTMAEVADPRRARRLVAQLWCTESWVTPLSGLANVDPALLVSVVDEWTTRMVARGV
ncbi:hypothetical protein GCM10027610_047340 [Dactylosporangium cerinum]